MKAHNGYRSAGTQRKSGKHPTPAEEYDFLSDTGSLIAVERNLEALPYFSVKTRKRSDEGSAQEYSWSDSEDGGKEPGIEGNSGARDSTLEPRGEHRTFRVLSNPRYGLPGPVDQDVYLAVVSLLDLRGGMPPSGVLPFTLYELVSLLGWPDCGTSYGALKESLRRMAATVIESERAFHSASTGAAVSDTFTLFSVRFYEEYSLFGERREGHRLVFHPYFVENYLESYLRSVDAGMYWTLSTPLARRLYRLVESDRQMAGERATVIRYTLPDLAKRLPLPAGSMQYVSKIKQALYPAHDELLGSGYLAAADFLLSEAGNTAAASVRYRIAKGYAERILRGDPFSGLSGEDRRAAGSLSSAGMSTAVARSLVEGYGASVCRAAVNRLARLQSADYPSTGHEAASKEEAKVDPRGSTSSTISGNCAASTAIKNPGGWLKTVIERGSVREEQREHPLF